MKFRDYQQKDFDEIVGVHQKLLNEKFEPRSVMYQLPTGGGKTIVANALSKHFRQKDAYSLTIAHRRELIGQAADKYVQAYGKPSGIIMSGFEENRALENQTASIQTLASQLKKGVDLSWLFNNTGHVLIDEAHRSSENARMYDLVLSQFKNAYKTGVTATPTTLNGKGFESQYDALVEGKTVSELQQMEHLLKEKTYIVSLSGEDLESARKGNEYSTKELTDMFVKGKLSCDYVKAWKDYASGCKTIFFAMSIAHSKIVVERFNNAGILAMHIDANTPAKERARILQAHKDGEFLILSNVGILCEGYDDPSIECVMCGRPTKSLIVAHQQRGRGLRPYIDPPSDFLGDTKIGRDQCIILDCANISVEHGVQNEQINWLKHFKGYKKKKADVERILIEEETGRMFTRQNVTENIPLSLLELDGNERFPLIRKVVRQGARFNHIDGRIARNFRKQAAPDSPTLKELMLIAALTGSTKSQAQRWFESFNRPKLVFDGY